MESPHQEGSKTPPLTLFRPVQAEISQLRRDLLDPAVLALRGSKQASKQATRMVYYAEQEVVAAALVVGSW